jgi:hypothetical protein
LTAQLTGGGDAGAEAAVGAWAKACPEATAATRNEHESSRLRINIIPHKANPFSERHVLSAIFDALRNKMLRRDIKIQFEFVTYPKRPQ